MNTLDILLDLGNYGVGTYTLKKDLSSYKEIIVVVSYIANNSNTTCNHIPITPFKEIPQDQYGWYIPIYETAAVVQTVYVRYVDDTHIQITNATNAIVRAIYGSY